MLSKNFSAVVFGSFVLGVLFPSLSFSAAFKVNTIDAFNQYRPEVGIDSSGQFLISWNDDSNFDVPSLGTGSPTAQIYSRRFNANTTAVDGTEVSLKGPHLSNYNYSTSSTAMNASGNYIVGISINPFASGTDLFRNLGSFGTGLPGTEVTVHGGAGAQSAPSVAINDSGDSIVSWMVHSGAIHNFQRYNSSGTAVGSRITAATGADLSANFFSNDITLAANGNALALWSSSGTLFGSLYNSSNTIINGKSQFQINSSTGTNSSTGDPQVAMDDAGNFIAVWAATDGNIKARRFDSSGNALGADFQVNDLALSNNEHPDIAIDSSGNFIVTWNRYDGATTDTVYARSFDSSGTANGGQFSIDTTTHDTRSDFSQNLPRPKVALNDTGNWVITWTNFVDTFDKGNDVYAETGLLTFNNTLIGTDVLVDLVGDDTVQFGTVTANGDTTKTLVVDQGVIDSFLSDDAVGALISTSIFEIASTATFTAGNGMTLVLSYEQADFDAQIGALGYTEEQLQIFHLIGGVTLEQGTILSRDTVGNTLTASFASASLSPFGVGVNPEPATLFLLGSALFGLLPFRKKLK